MRYLIISESEVPEATKTIGSWLNIVPILLKNGTYALPESVLPYLPDFQSRDLLEMSDVPFIVDEG